MRSSADLHDSHDDALLTRFGYRQQFARTLKNFEAILYAGTVLLYVFTAHRVELESGYFRLGVWEWPVIIGALAWLAYELDILIQPHDFRDAQKYALGSLLLGLVVFGTMWLLEPAAMRREPGAHGAEALQVAETAGDAGR